MKTEFLKNVKNVILKNSLLSPNDSVLIAVSGGADSVCLFDVLFSLKDEFNLTLYVAHLNHLIRDTEAKRDEDFVRLLCEKYGVRFFSESKDVTILAKKTKKSVEEAGRDARYDFFLKLKNELNIDKIATAHNKNDNVETVLMRLFRGTGTKGLSGIPIKNDLCVIRPLLYSSREQIEDYLKERNLSFVTDSTNSEDIYARNKIRHNLLPYIKENHNQSFIDTFSDSIALFKDANDYLEKKTLEAFEKLCISRSFGYEIDLKFMNEYDDFIKKSVIKYAINRLLEGSATYDLINIIFDALNVKTDFSLSISKDFVCYIKYNKLYFVKKNNAQKFEYNINTPSVFLAEIGATISFCCKENGKREKSDNIFYLKASDSSKEFTVRNRRQGDKIFLANTGHKKIKDLFIDKKIPVFLRDEIPLILCDNEIIWAVGIYKNPRYIAKENEPCVKIIYENN